MDLGFEASGFDIRAAVEHEEWACNTLRTNFDIDIVFGPPDRDGDMRNIESQEVLDAIDLRPGEVDIILGGPPCQPFSVAAAQRFLKNDDKFKRKGTEDEERGTLFYEFLRFIEEVQPRSFVLENVAGFAELKNGQAAAEFRQACSDLSYTVSEPYIADAKNYGVPQTRERVFIIGSKEGIPSFPERTHYPENNLTGKPGYNTVAHSLVDLLIEDESHVTRDHRQSTIERYKKLDYGERDHNGRVDRLEPHKPSKTVIAGGKNGGGRSHLHPFLARTTTPRECARFQSFPDSFEFEGPLSRHFTQIGNAVPPLLGERIAKEIKSTIFNEDVSDESEIDLSYPDISTTEACERVKQEAIARDPEMTYENLKLVWKKPVDP
jgi:DNA (cytosine-5)-methyltransferase 1